MADRKFSFWQKWLTRANVLTLTLGLLVAFARDSFFSISTTTTPGVCSFRKIP